MTPRAISQAMRVLVSGPMLLRQSKTVKNKYFKIALGLAGVTVSMMAINEYLKDREEEKTRIEKIKISEAKKLLIKLNEREKIDD